MQRAARPTQPHFAARRRSPACSRRHGLAQVNRALRLLAERTGLQALSRAR